MPPQKFVGRERELKELERNYQQTLQGNPEHTILYGQYGIGKTSLLIETEKRLKKANTIRISLFPTEDITEICDTILREAQAQLNLKPKILRERLEALDFTFLGTGAKITLGPVKMNPQSALKGVVSEIYDEAIKKGKNGKDTLVLLFDDLHEITGATGGRILSILSNVLTILNQQGKNIMFVATGAHDIFQRIRSIHESTVRIFHPLEILPFTKNETIMAVNDAAQPEGKVFEKTVVNKIHSVSSGIPYYIQILGYYSFQLAEAECKNKITLSLFNRGFQMALDDLARRKFRDLYETCTPEERVILRIFTETKEKEIPFTQIDRKTKINPSVYLKRLTENNILIKTRRGVYSLQDQMFKEYLQTYKPYQRNGTKNFRRG